MTTCLDIDFNPLTRSYSSGDTIVCQIQYKTAGGFVVALPKQDIRYAFLPTQLDIRIGQPVEAFYLNEENGKMIFTLTEDEFRKHARSRVKAFASI